jgi:3-hydroxyisobutyrate dehydrogenase
MVGRGYDNIDFAALLIETARDAGLELKSENKTISDGLSS